MVRGRLSSFTQSREHDAETAVATLGQVDRSIVRSCPGDRWPRDVGGPRVLGCAPEEIKSCGVLQKERTDLPL